MHHKQEDKLILFITSHSPLLHIYTVQKTFIDSTV